MLSRAEPDFDLIVSEYLAAWNAADVAARDRHLQATWSEAGCFRDPLTQLVGRRAMSTCIAAFRRCHPRSRFAVRGELDGHHHDFHVAWVLLDAAGHQTLGGRSVGELDGRGRIVRLVAFFDGATWPSATDLTAAQIARLERPRRLGR